MSEQPPEDHRLRDYAISLGLGTLAGIVSNLLTEEARARREYCSCMEDEEE